MVIAAATLFAVNGAVSKLALDGSDIGTVRWTELRSTGGFVGPRARARAPRAGAAPDRHAARARAARVLRRRRLRARAVALLRRDRQAADRDRAPVRVHGAGPDRAVGALRLARAGAPARLARARPRPRRPRARRADLARAHARRGRRRWPASSRRSRSRSSTSWASGSSAAATRSRSTCFGLGFASLAWAVVAAVVELPDRGAAHRRSSCRTASAPCRSRALALWGIVPRHDRAVHALDLGPAAPAGDDGRDRRDVRAGRGGGDRLGLARRDPRRGPDRSAASSCWPGSCSPRRRAEAHRPPRRPIPCRHGRTRPARIAARLLRGVERAVETVEKALEHYGAPVYVRKQIVHNIHVVRDLEARGAIFVDEETEVPARCDDRLLRARRRPDACTPTRPRSATT